jgi:competence protein ComEC
MNITNQKKIKIIIIFLGIFLGSIYIFYNYYHYQKNNDLEVSFIDVGQGDAIFIKTPEKHQVIIDFGSSQGINDLNKKIPWWNKKIDLAIITHPHDDHIIGLIQIIKNYKVRNIMYTGIIFDSPAYLELLKEIEKKNIPLLIPQKNQSIKLGKDCNLDILFPWESFLNKEIDNLNNSSIISQLSCQNSKFLFMGDAEIEVENEILKKGINIKSNVLKIGHHGSITSSQQEFLEKVDPQIAIIMVGKNNKFNHPSLRVLKRLEKLKIKTFRTDLDGTITIISDGKNIYEKINQK